MRKILLIISMIFILLSCTKTEKETVDPDHKPVLDENLITEKDLTPEIFDRGILLEDFTANWCGWCPQIIEIIENLQNDKNFIPIAIHAGNDGSRTPATSILGDKFGVTGYPYLNINRHEQYGNSIKNFDKLKELGKLKSDVGLVLKSFKEDNLLVINAGLSFTKDIEDVKICIYITENNVISTQKNDLSGNENHRESRFYDQPELIDPFTHNHVLRAWATDLFGDEILGKECKKDNLYLNSYDVDITDYTDGQYEIVVFITSKGEVINARKIIF